MLAFAGNSLLCRFALKQTGIDAASFTSIRIVSGAAALWAIARLQGRPVRAAGSWPSALALFAYAALFSFAYVRLSAATGALLLFGAVQATMIGHAVRSGERLGLRRATGVACAFGGLVALVLPGVTAPPPVSSLLMAGAGVAWGVYSLRGKGVADPIATTAGNFGYAVPLAMLLSAATVPWAAIDLRGAACALASGALTSGIGYAIWYTALRGLNATSAAAVQLAVPALAALGGIVLLGEAMSLRLAISSLAILGGIALVVLERPAVPASK